MSKNHQTKEYRSIRAVSLWLHDNKCYSCFKVSDDHDTHHLDHDSTNNELNNIVPLCKGCHVLYHHIPKRPPVPYKRLAVLCLGKVNFYKSKE